MSKARAAARPWEAPGFDGETLEGYGPAHFSCADGDNGKQKISPLSQSAQCEGVASNGPSGYGTIIAVKLSLVGGKWRVTESHNEGDAG